MGFTCGKCGIELDTEGGLKRHMTRQHGGYYAQDLRDAGVNVTERDIARSLDGGNVSIDSVIDAAPETENAGKSDSNSTRRTRGSGKENRDREREIAEFQRVKPQLIERWKRRLRVPYSLWARLANDPSIALSDKELEDGATLHVDFIEAMGWIKAGKVEAIIDVIFWHGATGLSRSQLGKQLLAGFEAKPPDDTPTN